MLLFDDCGHYQLMWRFLVVSDNEGVYMTALMRVTASRGEACICDASKATYDLLTMCVL